MEIDSQIQGLLEFEIEFTGCGVTLMTEKQEFLQDLKRHHSRIYLWLTK
jgi:hypothetical protein